MRILFTAPVFISTRLHYDFQVETLQSIKTKYKYEIALVNNYICTTEFKLQTKANCNILLDNPLGNSVAGAWNLGIDYGFEHDFNYIFVINTDILFQENAIDTLVDFAEKNKEYALWTGAEWQDRRTLNKLVVLPDPENPSKIIIDDGIEKKHWDKFDYHPHFSCFMVNKYGIDRLKEHEEGTAEPIPGYFDPGYKSAYFEDNDYHQRILLAGLKAVKCNSSIFYHYGSRTIKSDEKVELANVQTYEQNREYLKKKWDIDVHGKVMGEEERIALSYKTAFNIPKE